MHFFNHREPDTHKGDYGHALLIAGAYGKAGAAVLAASATLRAGAGLLTVHLPSLCVDVMQTALPEAMVSVDEHADHWTHRFSREELARYDAIAVGPGLGTRSVEALETLVANSVDKPLILDADALNMVSLQPALKGLLAQHRGAVVMTPHAKEYERLFGADATPEEGLERLRRLAQDNGWTIVRKGHRTLVAAEDGTITTNTTGNAGMATAGSGDVLTGILLGIMAQNKERQYTTAECVREGVRIHGQSGDEAVKKQSQCSLLASDIVKNICYVTM